MRLNVRELPSALTAGQERAIADIERDLARPEPMERLLQGEVGSGKTVVALYALLRAIEGGQQGALMVPTETLAEQHFLTLADSCEALGVRCVLLSSSIAPAEKASIRLSLSAGEAVIAIVTHALIQEGTEFRPLGVAIIDEEHRFGVEQRQALLRGQITHQLHLSATPIPRTLALALYGEVAVSEIEELPAGRLPVSTSWWLEEQLPDLYERNASV